MTGDINLFDSCWVKFRNFSERHQVGNIKIWPKDCQEVKRRRPFLLTFSKIEFKPKIDGHFINVTLKVEWPQYNYYSIYKVTIRKKKLEN